MGSMKGKVTYIGGGRGPSDYFKRFVTVLKTESALALTEMSRDVADQMAEEARSILDDQRYNWEPLQDYYVEYKKAHGLSEKTLISTGFYRDHIESWVWKGQVHVGVRKTIKHPSGIPLHRLAAIHERGTARIPARPLWRPLLAKYAKKMPEFRKVYHARVKKAIKSKIKPGRKRRRL